MARKKLSALDQAIFDKDVELTALYHRWEEASMMIEQDIRGGEPVNGPELLWAIIAPGEELEAASRQVAEELIARPFVPTARGRKVSRSSTNCCEQCKEWFQPAKFKSQQKYCSKSCRQKAYMNRRSQTCRNGHPRTPENTMWEKKDKHGAMTQRCRVCKRNAAKATAERRKKDPVRLERRREANRRHHLRHREKRLKTFAENRRKKRALRRAERVATSESRPTS